MLFLWVLHSEGGEKGIISELLILCSKVFHSSLLIEKYFVTTDSLYFFYDLSYKKNACRNDNGKNVKNNEFNGLIYSLINFVLFHNKDIHTELEESKNLRQ